MTVNDKKLNFKVTEALGKDLGRAYARLDPKDISKLGAKHGDIVEIVFKEKKTVCKLMIAYKEQRNKSLVQLDGITRKNAGTGLDEFVILKKTKCQQAESIRIMPIDIIPSERDLPYIGNLLDGLPVISGDYIRAVLFGNKTADFMVKSTNPKGAEIINPTTRLFIEKSEKKDKANKGKKVSYEDIGGLKPHLRRVREMIELPLRFPQVFTRLGIEPPKGVLLHGPPGCGKTLIARAIANETEASFFTVNGPEIIHKFYGESEAHLRKIFDDANKNSPAIIFIDEIDAVAPKREKTAGDVEKRVVAQLLALMDGLSKRKNVVVIAATNIPNALDPALRRPGRFDREITIPIPGKNSRLEILEIHSRGMPLAQNVKTSKLAEITHGFVGADLEALCREAAMICLRRIIDDIDFSTNEIPYSSLTDLKVEMEDFTEAFKEIEPSALREVFVEIPNVNFCDVGGLLHIKALLKESVIWPLKYQKLFLDVNLDPPRGILLTGLPGNGKT